MVFGRVALLGDAAFVARPHVGAGITKAALECAKARRGAGGEGRYRDGARALRQGAPRIRQRAGRACAHLGAYLEAAVKQRGAAERRPETVLPEYGTAGKIEGR